MKKSFSLVAATAVALAIPFHAQAQTQAQAAPISAPSEQRPHELLVEAFSPMSLHEITFANTLTQLDEFYRESPEFASIELACPGFVDALFKEAKPAMREFHFMEAALVRDLLLQIFTENFTAEQARQGVALYGSELGQKIVHLSGQNQNFRNTMDSVVGNEGGEVDRSAFDRDSAATTAKVIRSMSREEITSFAELAMATEFFPLLQKLLPEIQQRRFDLLNSDVLAEANGAFTAALDRGMQAHIEQCGL